MLSKDQIHGLLEQLEQSTAADLETQILDFKEWKTQSDKESIDMLIEAAVCMAKTSQKLMCR